MLCRLKREVQLIEAQGAMFKARHSGALFAVVSQIFQITCAAKPALTLRPSAGLLPGSHAFLNAGRRTSLASAGMIMKYQSNTAPDRPDLEGIKAYCFCNVAEQRNGTGNSAGIGKKASRTRARQPCPRAIEAKRRAGAAADLLRDRLYRTQAEAFVWML
jgi:hypothetical protein